MQDVIATAPRLLDTLGTASLEHHQTLCRQLTAAGISFQIDHRLVRGLDYYNRTVFEWVTDRLGSQGTIAGGGRYDTLVERLGGESTAACGFGIGLERVILLMQESDIHAGHAPDAYLVNVGAAAAERALIVAEQFRDAGLDIVLHAGGGGFKAQMKRPTVRLQDTP